MLNVSFTKMYINTINYISHNNNEILKTNEKLINKICSTSTCLASYTTDYKQ